MTEAHTAGTTVFVYAMLVTCSECQGLEASLEVSPVPQVRELKRWGPRVFCEICSPQLLGAKYWMGEIRKLPAVPEGVSKQVGPAEVWIMWGISFKAQQMITSSS